MCIQLMKKKEKIQRLCTIGLACSLLTVLVLSDRPGGRSSVRCRRFEQEVGEITFEGEPAQRRV